MLGNGTAIMIFFKKIIGVHGHKGVKNNLKAFLKNTNFNILNVS
jgi:hypothetical protein